jgi:class 3 adenylate cyclase/tetratricopeptide (TPR) repeat protein
VRCSKCEGENRPGRLFCASCGTALPVACGHCDFVNETGERFCGGCGRPIEARAAPAKSAQVVDQEGDRRPVTVLFCDLVGYSRLSSALDAEEVHALLERFFATVDSTVASFGGTIDKHIGDAVMALFGAPLAHGNDAERAVRAALEIQRTVPQLGSGHAHELAVHIGIATGEVIASSVGSQHHRGYTVTGEAANIAARLLEKAGSGETVVSDAVYQATQRTVSYEPLGPLALKGIQHAVTAWRLLGAKSPAAAARELVGRRGEIAQLRAVLAAASADSNGAAVLIRGEAGIGKTRLMDELQSIAGLAGMSCTSGYVLDFGTARGHGAVRTLVAGLLELGADAKPEAVERAIIGRLQADTIEHDDALYLRDLLEIPQLEASRSLYEAIDAAARTAGKERALTVLVKASADRRPLLLSVEDVHWADPETLGLLAAITRATTVTRTVLVMTTRIEGDPFDANWRSRASGSSIITIDLSPLSISDALSIARRFIDVATFAEQCVERAGGNPLFLEQLLRSAGDLTDGRLPASIQSVVLARTDLLSTRDRRAIQAASVLGQRFRLPQLRLLLREPNYECDVLVRNVLLRPAPDGLQFAHALIRDGVYGSLTNARKRELHLAAAEIFSDDPVLRAEHLDRAGDGQAARAYYAAAKAQSSLYRQDHAIQLATRGLELATEKRDRFEIAVLLGDLQSDAGRGTEALEAYTMAQATGESDADRCRALLGSAASNRLIARLDAASDALAEAEPLAASLGDDRALSETHYLRGNLHFARGRLSECRGEHELALEAARRIDSPEWQARALSGLADAMYMDCRMATALTHFSECVALCETHQLTRIAVPNRVMMGHCRIYTCAFDLGLEDMRTALEIAARIGNRHAEMFAAHSMGFCLTAAGRYTEAESVQPKALEQARALKARRYEAIILAHCAEVAISKGNKMQALSLARLGHQISEQTGPGFAGPVIYGLLALLEEKRDDQRAALAAGETLLAGGSVGHNHFWFRRYAIEHALLVQDWDEADRQAESLLLRTADEPLDYASRIAERGRFLAKRGRSGPGKLAETFTASIPPDAMNIDALSIALRS